MVPTPIGLGYGFTLTNHVFSDAAFMHVENVCDQARRDKSAYRYFRQRFRGAQYIFM